MSLNVYLYLDIDVGAKEPHHCELFTANITNNLNQMASDAGIYQACWKAEDIPGIKTAADLIPILSTGLELLKSNPDRFIRFNPRNGWGSYDELVKFVTQYLQACKNFPKAQIYCSR